MADDVRVTNWPEGGEAKATLDLFYFFRDALTPKRGAEQIAQHLHLVRACRRAVQGYEFDLSKIT